MKKVTFKPPYRVGKKSGTTVLDSNGIEVVNFRDEEKAQEYVEYLNKKEREKPFMDAIGKGMMDKAREGNPLPWYIIDHVNLIKDPTVEKHAKNPLTGEDVAKMWAKIARERGNDPNNEPCCDENNPCCCATYSPNMPSPEDVRDFLENRNIKPDRLSAPSFMIWAKLKELMNSIKKNKKKR